MQSQKKTYPLPCIDHLANAIVGHALLCFLNAHKEYHQIPMAIKDEEKTSFLIPDGLFCY